MELSMVDLLGSFPLPNVSGTLTVIVLVSLKMWISIVSSTCRLRRFKAEVSYRLLTSSLTYKALGKSSVDQ